MKQEVASGKIRLCVALLLGTTLAGVHASAAGGHPQIEGHWVSESGPGGRGGGPPGAGRAPGAGGPPPDRGGQLGGPPRRSGAGGGARPQPSEAGVAAAQGYEQPYDDPAIQCDIANIIFGWTHDQNVNAITRSGNTITLKYGYMDFVRSIHMESSHPRNLKPSRGGHSTGKWEGETLVVDTVALAPSVLVPMAGIMLSDQAHIVERFSLAPDGMTLTRDYVVEDPLYLKQPFSGRDVMRASKEPYTPYECVELSGDNNRRKAR
jgi:hypothetical protein